MGYAEIIKVTPDELDTCDKCNELGLKTSGRIINDSTGQRVMWFCFNCVSKVLG